MALDDVVRAGRLLLMFAKIATCVGATGYALHAVHELLALGHMGEPFTARERKAVGMLHLLRMLWAVAVMAVVVLVSQVAPR